jgi:hypothetical protein
MDLGRAALAASALLLAASATSACNQRTQVSGDDGGAIAPLADLAELTDGGHSPTDGGFERSLSGDGGSCGTWSCTTGAGRSTCTRTDGHRGLPIYPGSTTPGGSGEPNMDEWSCEKDSAGTSWVCVGAPQSALGSDWQCQKAGTGSIGQTIQKCKRTVVACDQPDARAWRCAMSTGLGGTVCVLGTVGDTCNKGERMWCDSLSYDVWQQVECDPSTGKWKTTVQGGKTVLDCREMASGFGLPTTPCGCYYLWYSPVCCELPSCLVPASASSAACFASPGKLCDPCNPLATSSCKETGAVCVVTNTHEMFCGRSCSSTNECPAGYGCMKVKQKSGTVDQCVPSDFSCWR